MDKLIRINKCKAETEKASLKYIKEPALDTEMKKSTLQMNRQNSCTSEEIKASILLGMLKKRVSFKKIDLLRKLKLKNDREAYVDDRVMENESSFEENYNFSSLGWEQQFVNPKLSDAVANLSKDYQALLHQIYVEELSLTEIAKYNGVSIQSVSKKKQRALKQLYAYLNS